MVRGRPAAGGGRRARRRVLASLRYRPPNRGSGPALDVRSGVSRISAGAARPALPAALRTSTADHALTEVSVPTTLGTVAREVSVANWRGGALLVYNRTDGDDPATRVSRVFAFLIQGHGRVRAVRH